MAKLSKIMLVEDEPDIREIASLALTELGGFNLTLCESGQQALDKLPAALPQLVLLDVMMPDMDGPTTLQKLRTMSEMKNVPVIFMTARVQANEVEEYLKLGALGVIPKPFDPATLSTEIIKIWNEFAEKNLTVD